MTMQRLYKAFAKEAARSAVRDIGRAISSLESVAESAHDDRFEQMVSDLKQYRSELRGLGEELEDET